ncbi:MAG: ABC transporter ATP-binding protein [Acidobacteriota bacterium]|nr:ABC transporter ATP-binding protein [Acidobacteriota bacterium]
MNAAIIETQGLRKVYKTLLGNPVEALSGVDIRVERGQAFGLLGPNGAGKTTLLKVLLGLARPTNGQARLMGEKVGTPSARLRIGYMPEIRNYPQFLTAFRCLSLFGHLHGIPSSKGKKRISDVLEDVDLGKWSEHKVGSFSKGMKQRLALAQALLNDPELLFLDEPAEGIDPLGRVVVRNILRRLRERGTTLFINSHLLTEVEMVCDEVAILQRGKIIKAGILAELTTREQQYRLTVASDSERVPAILNRTILEIEKVKAPAGLAAWNLTVHDRAELNRALDRLRLEDILVDSIEPVRNSLEEVFLGAIRDQTGNNDQQGSEGPPSDGSKSANGRVRS